MLVQLVCPSCRVPLKKKEAAWQCDSCHAVFKQHRGVLCFLDPEETLNETPSFEEKQTENWTDSALLRDRIRESGLLSRLNRLRIQLSFSGRRDRIFFQGLRPATNPSLILDLGCGGGRHYLCNYGKVVGVDPVVGLLQISKQIYDEVYQASAMALPFPDNTFDYVVSSDVIGHIPADVKDGFFSEMYRVLKKGGRTIHVIETDCNSCWFRLSREIPELFQERMIDRPGHVGLELPSQVHNRFLKHGFKAVAVKRFTSGILSCGDVSGMFGEAYKNRRWWLRYASAMDGILAKNLLVRELTNVGLELVAQVDDRLSPLDHASCVRVIYEK